MAGAAAPEPPWSSSVGSKRSTSDDEMMYVFKPALLPPDPASQSLQLRRNLADHLPNNTQVRRRT